METTTSLSYWNRWRAATTVGAEAAGKRAMLWVDAVGGFLVCLEDQLMIGQANPESTAAISLVGDLSRHHAQIDRRDDTYLLTPHAEVRVSGRPLRSDVILKDGDELELGASVVVRFRQPHPLSSTARLELLSGHRPEPAADAILLLSQSCILGPSSSAHVVCREMREELIMFRTSSQTWGCQHAAPFQVDGQVVQGRAMMTDHSRVCGEDFCFSLEPL